MQQIQQRQQPQQHGWDQAQQPQQYRVLTTPLQTSNMGQTDPYTVGQANAQPAYKPQPNVIYFGQSGQAQQQAPLQQTPLQQTYQPQTQQQQPGQVMYARPASQSYAPSGNAYPTQAQYAPQASTGTITYQPSNQVAPPAQPITVQPSHQVNQTSQQYFNQAPKFQQVPNSSTPLNPSPFQEQNQQIYYQNQPKPQSTAQPYSSQPNFNQTDNKPTQVVQSIWGTQPNNQVFDHKQHQQYHQPQQSVQTYQPVQSNQLYTQNTLPSTTLIKDSINRFVDVFLLEEVNQNKLRLSHCQCAIQSV
ncbi:unnamed protein product [Heterobilharzia americana]|nr:unnamed protein product [Heterobilharzia americana]